MRIDQGNFKPRTDLAIPIVNEHIIIAWIDAENLGKTLPITKVISVSHK